MAYAIRESNNLYAMSFRTVVNPEANVVSLGDLKLWHERLGHVNVTSLREMIKKNLVEGVKMLDVNNFFCEGCQYGKQYKLPFSSTERRKTVTGELIYCDLGGPMNTLSESGAKYYILFKDDASAYRTVMFLKHKSDSFDCFKQYASLCKNKFGQMIKILRSDNGTEFNNAVFQEFLKRHGIQHETTTPYTPEQNARLERENRTVVESARSMLYTKDLPKSLWAEAINTAVYVLNRTPTTQILNSTPFEIWHGRKPTLDHIRLFGSEAYVLTPKGKHTKLDPKRKKLILVGYDKDSTNYRLFDPVTKKITISRNVIFNETAEVKLPRKNTVLIQLDNQNLEEMEVKEGNKDVQIEEEEDVQIEEEERSEEDNQLKEKEARVLRPRETLRPPKRYESNLVEADVPLTFDEAMNSLDSKKWKEAIDEELDALNQNDTWELVPLPPDKRSISSK